MGNKSSSLPYDVGDRVCGLSCGWALHDGRKRKSGEPVSVLKFDKKAASSQDLELAENFFKRIKTLRHPNVLTYRDGLDSDTEIFIVTDAVSTLESWLRDFDAKEGSSEDKKKMAVGWGFHAILQALGFINEDCKLCHGNISLESIMVTRGGDWKLAGFFVIGEMDPTGPDRLFRENPNVIAAKYKPPERLANKWSFMNSTAEGPAPVDVFALGRVLFECFSGPVTDITVFDNLRQIPSQMHKVYRLMTADTPGERPDCKKLLKHPSFKYLFRNEMFSALSFLEELQLKTDAERAPFIQKLPEMLPRFPKDTNRYKILPALRSAFRYAEPGAPGTSVPGSNAPGSLRVSPLATMLLVPFLQIAADMDETEDVKRMVVPVLVELFGSQDRALRAALLQKLSSFIKYIDDKIINEQLFPQVASGFRDAAPLLRELTIKCVVSLAPQLAPKTLNETLLRHLVQSQQDKEPAIRTNTLICLNKLLANFNEETRKKVILSSFPQAVRDPFVPARMSGLRGLKAGLVYLEGDSSSLAGKVIPSLAYALIDPSPDVREMAFQIVEKCVADLKAISIKRAEEQRRESEEAKKRDVESRQGGGASAGAGIGSSMMPSLSAGGSSTSLASAGLGSSTALDNASGYFSQAAGWAVGSLSRGWGTGSQASASSGPQTPATADSPAPLPAASAEIQRPDPAPMKGLSLKSGKLAAPDTGSMGGWGNDADDDDDDLFNDSNDDDGATAGGSGSAGGWGDDGDDEDLLFTNSNVSNSGSLRSFGSTSSFTKQASSSKLQVPSNGDFFGDMTSEGSKAPKAPSTASARTLGLSASSQRTPSPSLSEASSTSQDRARKREEARQRIAQRRDKIKAKPIAAKPTSKSNDGDDDWDNW